MQGLPDHAHEPTLRRLPRGMRVVASPAGAKVAAGLGFTNITALDHGQETTIADGKLTIRATAGRAPRWSFHSCCFWWAGPCWAMSRQRHRLRFNGHRLRLRAVLALLGVLYPWL
jgi:hypothetical protein